MAQETSGEGKRVRITVSSAPIMKGSLVISLGIHLVILAGLQKAFPVDWVAKPLQTYHVELLRPPLDPLEEDEKAATELAKTKSEKSTAPAETEDTISLETTDKRYSSYAKTIKARLMQHWKYPQEAWENLKEGEVLVLFSLNRQGQLKGVNILKSSYYAILDDETTRTIKASAPFPPFPGSVTVKKLNIKANFVYRLTALK
jgi:protein TonB